MRVAIVHYHLKRGGVTRVIQSAVSALHNDADVLVLTGDADNTSLDCPVREIPELQYCEDYQPEIPARLAQAMKSAARDAFGGDPDLWHIHNHSLGKNIHFLEALQLLLQDGTPALLQIHDFPEDGRPGNYQLNQIPFQDAPPDSFARALYPQASQIHYGVLNGRDYNFLKEAGWPQERIHAIPNAVTPPDNVPEINPTDPAWSEFLGARSLALYPTRGIRRKNIGETVLLSLLSHKEFLFATTLPPENPQWQSIHQAWAQWCRCNRAPVHLGAVENTDFSFESLMARADILLTTSITEGFGLAFLEPWLIRKTIRGRDLPEITRDFKQEDIILPDLYPALPVPHAWINKDYLFKRLESALSQYRKQYGIQTSKNHIQDAWNSLVAKNTVDFGCLDEPAQFEALDHLIANPHHKSHIEQPTLHPEPEATINQNQSAVLNNYGLEAYRQRLLNIYQCIASCPKTHPKPSPAQNLLSTFLQPQRFHLLKT